VKLEIKESLSIFFCKDEIFVFVLGWTIVNEQVVGTAIKTFEMDTSYISIQSKCITYFTGSDVFEF
jgi:hypothetical protein